MGEGLGKLKKTVYDLKNKKASAPDVFPAEFSKTFWNNISDIVSETYIEA